jgi:NADP-dependent 3-hydroxy acid dehydrogenase YdfG
MILTVQIAVHVFACSPAVYVVFGASGGIGSALSKRLLAQPGSTVVLAGRDEAKLQQLVSTLGGGACA